MQNEVFIPDFHFTIFYRFIRRFRYYRINAFTPSTVRYFLVPLTWPMELTLICFVWTALLGALLAKRTDSHVVFSMVYDAANPKVKLYVRLGGNLLLFISFCIALYPSYDYVVFMGFKKSNVLKIPMDFAFSPFIVFLVFMIGRIGKDLLVDIKKLLRGDL